MAGVMRATSWVIAGLVVVILATALGVDVLPSGTEMIVIVIVAIALFRHRLFTWLSWRD